MKNQAYLCEDRCKASDSFFLGAPWMKIGSVTAREGDKVDLICQIWNGVSANPYSWPSANASITHNGRLIHQKLTIAGSNETAKIPVWGEVEVQETVSPGAGYFSEFFITLKNFTSSLEGNISCENGIDSNDNIAKLTLQVDGRWTEWGVWEQCSKSCVKEDSQTGVRKRKRECIHPRNGGAPCEGLGLEEGRCPFRNGSVINCPINHRFSQWSSWGSCSATCGWDGIKYRFRSCTQGRHGGSRCPTSWDRQERSCNFGDCPVDCEWDSWGQWGSCSEYCGLGTKTRYRYKDVYARDGGRACAGQDTDETSCFERSCQTSNTRGGSRDSSDYWNYLNYLNYWNYYNYYYNRG